MLHRVDRILLRVPSLPAAARYYAETLGLRPLKKEKQLVSFQLGEAELVLHNNPDLPAEGVYYRVDSVRDWYQRREEMKLTFVSPPVRSTRGWRATVKDPFGIVMMLLDQDDSDVPSGAIEDGQAPGGMLFAGMVPKIPAKREALSKLYEQLGRTADDLPYTPHFEQLYKDYSSVLIQSVAGTAVVTREEVWRHLLNLRKGGKLPKLGAAKSIPPEITEAEKMHLCELVGDQIGRRDRLPYTPRFDEIVDEFNKTQPRPLSPHLVWRLVATLAK